MEAAQPSTGPAMPQIWFFLRGYKNTWHEVDSLQGWQKLFMQPDTPWPPFMDHVQVLAVAGTDTLLSIPDDVLAKAFAQLRQKHIAFAIEMPAQNFLGQPKCGRGVEGYTDPATSARVARKIKGAGGEISFVSMDGTLMSGHFSNADNACHSSIQNVAERAAQIMRVYQEVFPDVVVGDIEPIPSLVQQPDWQAAYRQWQDTFRAAFGKPIAYVIFDVNWPQDNGRWRWALPQAASFARANGLPIGVIYNASIPGGAKSDEEWLDAAAHNFAEVETKLGIVPDKVLFESWAYFPKRSITDANGLGEDYLVKQYLQMHKPSNSLRSREAR